MNRRTALLGTLAATAALGTGAATAAAQAGGGGAYWRAEVDMVYTAARLAFAQVGNLGVIVNVGMGFDWKVPGAAASGAVALVPMVAAELYVPAGEAARHAELTAALAHFTQAAAIFVEAAGSLDSARWLQGVYVLQTGADALDAIRWGGDGGAAAPDGGTE